MIDFTDVCVCVCVCVQSSERVLQLIHERDSLKHKVDEVSSKCMCVIATPQDSYYGLQLWCMHTSHIGCMVFAILNSLMRILIFIMYDSLME